MTSSLTFRALAALPAALQTLARQHVQQYPDDLDDLISELAIALLELADRATDASRVFARARSRIRRATQDLAHYSVPLDIERHDVEQDDEDETTLRRQDIVREVAERQRVTLRRAQQIVRRAIERANQGDLFINVNNEGGER